MSDNRSVHRVNGVDISTIDVGVGAPTLLFLHYWGGSIGSWLPVVQDLSEDHRCFAMDFRGWGRSSKDAADYRLETLADDVLGIVGQLGLTDFVIVGHSMGGKVAQLVAARRPEGLQGLILMAPAPPTALDVPEEQRRQMSAANQSSEGVMSVISALPLSEAHRELIVEDALRGAPAAKHAWPIEGMIEDIRDHAAKIVVPAHIIVGSADVVETEVSLRAAFGPSLPGAGFTVLPGLSHMAPLEAPATVAEAVRAGLDAINTSPRGGAHAL